MTHVLGLKKLEDGDEEATHLWEWFRSESLKLFMKIYDVLGIEFDSFNGEAFYNDKMDEVVQMLEDKHLLQESKGAEIVDLEKYDLNPALIKKTDGATLYITRDLAAAFIDSGHTILCNLCMLLVTSNKIISSNLKQC